MARCPYCDEEYTPGEMYCKKCLEDLTDLDQQPEPATPEREDPLAPLELPLPQDGPPATTEDETEASATTEDETEASANTDGETVGSDAPPSIPDVPDVPLAPTMTQVAPTPSSRADSDAHQEPKVESGQVGPVCSSCGMTNERDSKFCDGCGKPMGATCPSCQGTNRPGAKFCQHCGNRLGEAAPSPASPVAADDTVGQHPPQSAVHKHYALVLLDREGRESTRYPLREGANQVGAKSVGEGIAPDIDLRADDEDQVISRRHAILRVAGDQVTIADCGSTNGTRVDGAKISSVETLVNERSSIVLGNLHARIVQF